MPTGPVRDPHGAGADGDPAPLAADADRLNHLLRRGVDARDVAVVGVRDPDGAVPDRDAAARGAHSHLAGDPVCAWVDQPDSVRLDVRERVRVARSSARADEERDQPAEDDERADRRCDAASRAQPRMPERRPRRLLQLALTAGIGGRRVRPVPPESPLQATRTRPLPATGPYMIASYRPKHVLTLVRNARFHEWLKAAQPAGYPDRIVF